MDFNQQLMNFDAQAAFGFVQAQGAHIETVVNQTVYGGIQYQDLVPVDYSAHPFTQTVNYYSSDYYGKAAWINGNSDDIPLVGAERDSFKTSVYTAAIGYTYGWEEVNVAMMYGTNLPADGAQAARRAYEEHVDDIVLRGDTEKNFFGMFNYPGIDTIALPHGDWNNSSTTEDQMLEDVNAVLFGQATGVLYTQTAMANTLILPWEKMSRLSTKRLGDTQGTVLEFLRKNNAYTAMTGQPLMIRAVRGLATAGAGGTGRMIAYRRAPDVLKVHIPMEHRFLPVFQRAPLNWEVPGVYRLGGLDVRRKKEFNYGDGI